MFATHQLEQALIGDRIRPGLERPRGIDSPRAQVRSDQVLAVRGRGVELPRRSPAAYCWLKSGACNHRNRTPSPSKLTWSRR